MTRRFRIAAAFAILLPFIASFAGCSSSEEEVIRFGLAAPLEMYLGDVFTVPASLAGLPGISVPIGRVRGLPVGAQILAPWWREEPMLAAAGALESRFGSEAV